mmetsp:Transcript_4035/g.8168  ORF Transcript_4035/g.8168 Transcript_4035/m.8168 type:complete len:554 (-) Transcript_4035:320-1981(-)
MVCASSFAAGVPAAEQMAWMHCRGPADWSEKNQALVKDSSPCTSERPAAVHEVQASKSAQEVLETATPPPTAAVKEVLKLRKKLREIAKIEERLDADMGVDLLQQRKLDKKSEVVALLEQAEYAAAEEQSLVLMEEDCLQDAEVLEQNEESSLPAHADGREEAYALQMASAQMFSVPMVMCDIYGQPQQQAFVWPAYTQTAQVPQFILDREQAMGHAEICHGTTEQHDQTRPGQSTSARRRMRRQRAAARKVDAAFLYPSEASATTSQLPSPRSDASSDNTERLNCAKLTEDIDAGGESRAAALAKMRGSVSRLAFEHEGCRVVQAALQVANHEAAAELLAELQGRVRAALTSPHANYVIQTIITALPTTMSSFVVKELMGLGAGTARHRFGCRILCRLIEHSSASAELDCLLGEVLAEAEELCRHPFAHFVLQCMLEHVPAHRARIAEALRGDLPGNACDRCASHVVESALALCSDEDRHSLALQLLGPDPSSMVYLAQNQFGSFVLKTFLEVPGRISEEAWSRLSQSAAHLEGTKYGLRLLQDLDLRTGVA